MPEAVADALPEHARLHSTRIFVFCSGKGGTGRTTLAAAFALAAIEAGLRVRVVDADRATAGLTRLLHSSEDELRDALLPQDDFEVAVDQAEAALAARPGPPSPAVTRQARPEALESLLRAVSRAGLHDLVLVDAPAGTGTDSLALAAAADGLLLVVDPATLHGGQARLLMAAIELNRRRKSPVGWCGVIVNRAPAGMDGSDLAAIARDTGLLVDRIALIGMDANVLQDPQPHASVAADRAATLFAHDALRAFDALLADELAAWPELARERWRALVVAKAREVARIQAQRDLEAAAQRKWLEHWPRLEEEDRRRAAELGHARASHAQELLRQSRQIEELRLQLRVLRASLETARLRANARRTRMLAASGLGFAGGALLALVAIVSLGRWAGMETLDSGVSLLSGLRSTRQPDRSFPAPPAEQGVRPSLTSSRTEPAMPSRPAP